MSKDPYYKCNTVTPEEQSDLQNQGAKFANDAVQNSVNWSFYVLSLLIVVGFIALNTKIEVLSKASSSLILLTLVICLFFVLIFWFTSIARSEGFKGKRKNKKGKSKKKSNGNKKKSNRNKKKSNRNNNSVTTGTKNEPKPVKQKSNLNPTLIAVLPVLAFGFIATIANVLYHR